MFFKSYNCSKAENWFFTRMWIFYSLPEFFIIPKTLFLRDRAHRNYINVFFKYTLSLKVPKQWFQNCLLKTPKSSFLGIWIISLYFQSSNMWGSNSQWNWHLASEVDPVCLWAYFLAPKQHFTTFNFQCEVSMGALTPPKFKWFLERLDG